jgi:acyl carrier protein
MDKQSALLEFIKQDLMKGRPSAISVEDDLMSAGILDSLSLLQLVTFIEEQFGINVPDEDVLYENFHSIKVLSEYLGTLSS